MAKPCSLAFTWPLSVVRTSGCSAFTMPEVRVAASATHQLVDLLQPYNSRPPFAAHVYRLPADG